MRIVLLSLLFLFSNVAVLAQGRILAAFAHPDDETLVSPLLARYADEGHDVYILYTTSGQVGVSNTDIPAGEELGKARQQEATCAARALGVKPPVLLDFMDGQTATREVIPELRERIESVIRELQPDVLITFGPDGVSGHPDHRTVSNLVTQIFQKPGGVLDKPVRLYYIAIPGILFDRLPESMRAAAGGMANLDYRWVTAEIEAMDFLEETARAIRCHETQWPPEVMEQNISLWRAVLQGKVYLREPFAVSSAGSEKETDLF